MPLLDLRCWLRHPYHRFLFQNYRNPYLDNGRPAVDDDHLFISQRTKRGLTARAVQRLVAKYARLAELEDVTAHVLRHSFGKGALNAGMDVVSVAALMGHENLKTTMVYTRPSEAELQAAIDRMGVT